jgi:hypothetical protein
VSDLHLASGRGGAPAPQGAVSLCFDWEAFERLKASGVEAPAWEDLIAAEDAAPLLSKTLDLAASWHQDEAGDFTDFNGYSLGRLYRWLLWIETLYPAYKFLTGLSRTVDRQHPRIVHCEASVPELCRKVLACAADPLGLRVESVSAGTALADSKAWRRPAAELPLFKRLAGYALNVVGPAAGDGSPEWLLSYYHSLESVADAARRSGARISFADFPPIKRIPSLLGSASVWLEPGMPPRLGPEEQKALDGISARWKKLKSSPGYSDRFKWKSVSLFPLIEPILDDFVFRQTRNWAWTCLQLEKRWKNSPPALVLLPYPGPPYQTALQAAAKRHGTPAAVLLHGLPFSYSFPYEQPQDGVLIAWGPEQERLYGPSPAGLNRRVVTAGNPYFDRYAGERPTRTGPIRRLLLLTHPVIRSTALASDLDPARYIVAAARVLADFPELETEIRLHPSESVEYYRRLVGPISPRTRIVKGGPLSRSLENCDLVVGSFSTVLLEGLLSGLPVAALNLSRDEFPPPFDGKWGVPLLRSGEQFAELLRAAQDDPDALRRKLYSRSGEIIARFAGPVDGNAAERAVAALRTLERRAPDARGKAV